MGTIQSSINKMIGSASHAVGMVRGINALKAKQPTQATGAVGAEQPMGSSPQKQASQEAMQNMQNELEAKRSQKQAFADMHTSLGRMGDLPEDLQKRIKEELNKNGRK